MPRLTAPLLLALVALVPACKRSSPASTVKSGFTGTDCQSLYDQYATELQPRLRPAADKYVASFRAFKAAQAGAGSTSPAAGDGSTSPSDAGSGTTSPTTASTDPTATALQLDDAPSTPSTTSVTRPDGTLPDNLALPDAGIPSDVANDPLFAVNDNGSGVSGSCWSQFKPTPGAVADQVFNDCQDFYSVLSKMNAAATAFNANATCYQGGYRSFPVNPELYAFCDTPCQFSDSVNCTQCNVTYTTPASNTLTNAVVCETEAGVQDVGSAFCTKMGALGYTNCSVSNCSTAAGASFSGGPTSPQASGQSSAIYTLQVGASAGVAASASISAGVVADAAGSVTGNLLGSISIYNGNDAYPISTTTGICQAQSTFICKASFQGFVIAQSSFDAGVGGSFKIFGNGASAKAVVTAGANVQITAEFDAGSGPISCAGIGKEMMGQQCIGYFRDLLAGKITEASGFAEKVQQQIQQQIAQRVTDMGNQSAADLAAQQAQAQQTHDAATSAGQQQAGTIYSNLSHYFAHNTACYNYGSFFSSNYGISAEGQQACQDAANGYSGDQSTYDQACTDELSRKCHG